MAATGTPTPNLGLRIPQGTDPASVDDINYNSNLLDTKIGAIGNDSVKTQIDALNGKISWNRITSGADSVTIPSDVSECICYAFKSGTTNYIPIMIDLNSTGYYRGGQYFSNNSGFAASVLYDSSTRIASIAQFYMDGVDNTSSAIIKVYAR